MAVLAVLRKVQTWSSVECLVSFLHVIDIRLSSAHCITNQCYHSKFKCNHVQTCTESGSLLSRFPGRDSGEKKLFSFKNIQYKYLNSSQWKEECV